MSPTRDDTISKEVWGELNNPLFCFKCGKELRRVLLSLTGTSAYWCTNPKCSKYRLWQEGLENKQ